jgi:hypothetical protein
MCSGGLLPQNWQRFVNPTTQNRPSSHCLEVMHDGVAIAMQMASAEQLWSKTISALTPNISGALHKRSARSCQHSCQPDAVQDALRVAGLLRARGLHAAVPGAGALALGLCVVGVGGR